MPWPPIGFSFKTKNFSKKLPKKSGNRFSGYFVYRNQFYCERVQEFKRSTKFIFLCCVKIRMQKLPSLTVCWICLAWNVHTMWCDWPRNMWTKPIICQVTITIGAVPLLLCSILFNIDHYFHHWCKLFDVGIYIDMNMLVKWWFIRFKRTATVAVMTICFFVFLHFSSTKAHFLLLISGRRDHQILWYACILNTLTRTLSHTRTQLKRISWLSVLLNRYPFLNCMHSLSVFILLLDLSFISFYHSQSHL